MRQEKRKSQHHHINRRVRARFHGYAHEEHRGVYHGGGHTIHSAMDEGGATKHAKLHEAHMIPGVDGKKVFGFPNTIITKLRYCDSYSLASTTTRAVQVFAANGIFDPDITGIGHQPLYRDNYAAIYDNYVVLGARIKVTFATTQTAVPVICGIIGDDDSSVSNQATTLQEQNNAVSILSSGAGSRPHTLELTFEPKEDFGIDAKSDGASQTSMGANPTQLFCFAIWTIAGDATTTCTTIAKVEIDYTVKFSELQTQTAN